MLGDFHSKRVGRRLRAGADIAGALHAATLHLSPRCPAGFTRGHRGRTRPLPEPQIHRRDDFYVITVIDGDNKIQA